MWDKDDASFGAWLRRHRRGLDLTQAELGRRVGISAAAVRKIEADERRPSAQVAARLADILGVSLDERDALLRRARGIATPLLPPSTDSSIRALEAALPVPLTPLIGRESLIAAVRELLERPDVRLVTLTGPGGVGKTRVALQVASELRAAGQTTFPDGVVVVPLATTASAAGVDTLLALALGLRDRGERPTLDQLLDALRARRLLLILDNAEHVLEAVPHLVALLRGAPGLRLLVTSRALLHVGGEHVVEVPLLGLPGADADEVVATPAMRLFLDRARAVAPGHVWLPEDLTAAAAICRRLDGLPLAIELAAARSRLLSPRTLLAQLETSPLETLAGARRDLPPRQQTLRATLDWSVGLLDEREQALLFGLGLFTGSWSLALAQAALGPGLASLDGLTALVDHSLVRRVENRAGEQRFELLDVVRHHALGRLAASGEEAARREGWARALLALAEEAARELRGPAQSWWLARLDDERANLSGLLTWALAEGPASPDRRTELGIRLVGTLVPYWWRRGAAGEARHWVDAALAASGAGAEARASLLAQAGRLAWQQGEHSLALARAEEALALSRSLGAVGTEVLALLTLGAVRWHQGDSQAAEVLLAECLALAEARDLAQEQTDVALLLALVAYHRGEHERREVFLAQSLARARACGDSLGIAEGLIWAGNISVEQGVLEQSEPVYQEARELFVALGDREGEARALHKLGDLAHDRGELGAAEQFFAACLTIRRAIGDREGVATALIGRGDVRLRQGDLDGAASCYGEALALIQARGDFVDQAWATRGLARVARARGELALAHQLFEASLRLAWAQGNPWGIAVTLEELGGALAFLGKVWDAGCCLAPPTPCASATGFGLSPVPCLAWNMTAWQCAASLARRRSSGRCVWAGHARWMCLSPMSSRVTTSVSRTRRDSARILLRAAAQPQRNGDDASLAHAALLDGQRAEGRARKDVGVPISTVVVGQLAVALDAAHALGVIHRDVKPGNAIWNAAGSMVLTDFGIAKQTLGDVSQTQTGIVIGTPAYLSPEQAQGQTLTPASDIYALGVVLYELLAGVVLFPGATLLHVALAHVQAPPPDIMADGQTSHYRWPRSSGKPWRRRKLGDEREAEQGHGQEQFSSGRGAKCSVQRGLWRAKPRHNP